jgi:hypothetical protein
MADDLYERDFFLWTQAQAQALRAHAGASNALDYENLAEAVEDLGRSERNKAESFARQILVHLYELHASPNPEPMNRWRAEIAEFRVRLRKSLTGAIRRQLEADLDDVHRDAIAIAEEKVSAYEADVAIDGALRWTLPQVLGEADDPLPPRRSR